MIGLLAALAVIALVAVVLGGVLLVCVSAVNAYFRLEDE